MKNKNTEILLENFLRKKIRKMLEESIVYAEDITQQPVVNQQVPPQQTQKPAPSPAVFNDLNAAILANTNGIAAKLAPHKELETLDEGIALALGAILSAGKAIQLAGSGLAKIGMKADINVLNKVGSWLEHAGHSYTSVLEKSILTILEKIPVTQKLMSSLTDAQKHTLSVAILTAIVSGMFLVSGAGAIKALLSGENLLGTIESILTGVKGSEIVANIPKIIEGIVSSAIHEV